MDNSEIIRQGFEEAQRVVDNTTSYLCRAMSLVNDNERVSAFNVMYSIMRIVDNIVDEREDSSKETLERVRKEVESWEEIVNRVYTDNPEQTPISLALLDVLSKFKIPKEIWDDFFESMRRDLGEVSFETFSDFKRYCRGATCSPTIIYLFILLSKKSGEIYKLDNFDYLSAGRNLGTWAYIVHILRDIKKDVDNSLFYLPKEELGKFNLTPDDLLLFSKTENCNEKYEDFLEHYLGVAQSYHDKSISETEDYLKEVPLDRSVAVLGVIRLYEEISRRLLTIKGEIFSGSKPLSKEESQEIVKNLMLELKKREHGKN